MSGSWSKWIRSLWTSWGMPILVAALLVTSFRSAVADWNDIPSGSMRPTLLEGDRIFVNKLAYDLKLPYTTHELVRWGDPQRGDIVILFSPADGKRLVKRVVALPGDTILLRNNHLILNGEPVEYGTPGPADEEWATDHERQSCQLLHEGLGPDGHPILLDRLSGWYRSFGPVTVPEGHYFVMGDNRDHSADSRVFGFVPRDQIVGRVTAVVFSLRRPEHFLPRWDRFFQHVL